MKLLCFLRAYLARGMFFYYNYKCIVDFTNMDKKTLKDIVQQLKSIVDLLESEVYSDIKSWTVEESNLSPTYADINDEDGDYD